MRDFMEGALFLGYLVIALFFLRFWRRSLDRLFAYFALAFAILAASRLALTLMHLPDEAQLLIRTLRLVAFLLILWAIIDKNRRPGRGATSP
ncbi:MAG TPA: DUF5985 family protein [Planctomycetota bacterium]|nr:DUF5985 family protein [Planctomycetota bacterium]